MAPSQFWEVEVAVEEGVQLLFGLLVVCVVIYRELGIRLVVELIHRLVYGESLYKIGFAGVTIKVIS